MTAANHNLARPVIRGSAWLLSMRVLNRGLMFARTFILARLLAPGDFGVMGMALLAASVLQSLSEPGFSQALIQRRRDEDDFWDTAYWILAGRGMVLGALLFLGAPAVAGFFHAPEQAALFRAVAVIPILTGLTNLGVLRGVRELAFRRQFVFELGMNLTNTAVAVGLGIAYRSVWALVAGEVAGRAAGVLISWTYGPNRVRARLSRYAGRELFGFGRWLNAAGILNFLLLQGDDLLVGRMLGPGAMGWYQMAYRISHAPMTELAQVVGSATLPAFSRMGDDLARTRRAFLRVLTGTTLISFPLGLMIIVAGPDFTLQVLGLKWMPMAPALQVLGVFGIARSVWGTLQPVFIGQGRPDLLTKMLFAQVVVLAALIFTLIPRWGILGAAAAAAGSAVIVNPAADLLLIRLIGLRAREFLGALVPGTVAGAAAALPALAAWLALPPGWVRLGVEAAGGLAGLGAAVIVMEWIGLPTLVGELRNYLGAPAASGDES